MKDYQQYSFWIALLDYLPVVLFGVGAVMLGYALGSPLMVFGALIVTVSGLFKATWKLINYTTGRDVAWLSRTFFPLMLSGWLAILVGLLLNLDDIVPARVSEPPQVIFYLLWIAGMVFFAWYKKNRYEKGSYKSNLEAELINTVIQLCLFAGSMFTGISR